MSNEPQGGMNFDRALVVLRRRGPIVLICMIIAGGSAFAFARHQAKQYTATASLLFQNNVVVGVTTGLTPVTQNISQSQQDTNVKLVGLGDIARQTAAALHNGWSAGQIRAALAISPSGDTSIVHVSATAPTPKLAQNIANTYSQLFVKQQQQTTTSGFATAQKAVMDQYHSLTPTQQNSAEGASLLDRAQQLSLLTQLDNGNVTVAGLAGRPTSPSGPQVSRDTALGIILGLLVGLAIAFVLERLDRRVMDPKELERIYELPLLAAVPERSSYEVLTSLGQTGPNGPPTLYDEVFNLLRAYLRYFSVDRDLRTLLVVSAGPGEGKTTVSYNLAKAAAALGSRVLLIEADMRRGTVLGPVLGRPDPALPDVLIGEATMEDAIHSVQIGHNGVLDVLVAGEFPPPNTGALIESHAMETVIERARAQYDLVVIDTPPLNLVGDAIPLLTKVDGAIIVARLGRSRRDAAEQLHKRIVSLRAPMLGIVANAVTGGGYRSYGYGYGYVYNDRMARRTEEPAMSSNGAHPAEVPSAELGD